MKIKGCRLSCGGSFAVFNTERYGRNRNIVKRKTPASSSSAPSCYRLSTIGLGGRSGKVFMASWVCGCVSSYFPASSFSFVLDFSFPSLPFAFPF
jgi:hypothetical protein